MHGPARQAEFAWSCDGFERVRAVVESTAHHLPNFGEVVAGAIHRSANLEQLDAAMTGVADAYDVGVMVTPLPEANLVQVRFGIRTMRWDPDPELDRLLADAR